MDVLIRALPLCDSLRYVTSEVLIGVLHVRNNHSLTHTRSIYTVAYPEFQRGGCLRWGGGGGGRDYIYNLWGRGGPVSGPIRKVCVCVYVGGGGEMQSASSPIQKVGAFGTANTLSL